MFRFKNRFSTVLLIGAVSLSAILTSCGDGTQNAVTDESTSAGTTAPITEITPEQQALIDDVSIFLDDMYNKFNSKDFSAYVEYWHIDESEKATMLQNLTSSSETFDTQYKVTSVFAQNTEDRKVSVSAITESTSTNISSNFKTLLKETHYFILSQENGTYYITNYAAGETEIINSGE